MDLWKRIRIKKVVLKEVWSIFLVAHNYCADCGLIVYFACCSGCSKLNVLG